MKPVKQGAPEVKSPAAEKACALLLVIVAAVLALIPTLDRSRTVIWFYTGSYYLMLALGAAWALAIVAVLREEKTDIRAFFRGHGSGLVLAILFAALAVISTHPQFRLLSDETNLLSVSKSMLYDKHVANVTQGKWFHLNFYAEEYQPEKRPFLFPFCTYLLHVLFGFRVWHPFVVNALALAATLFLIFVFLKKRVGAAAAAGGMLLVLAQPVVTQTAASAGMDMLSALCLTAGLMSLGWFLEKPGPGRFLLVWFQFLLLSHARYEGFLYFGVLLGALGWNGKLRAGFFRPLWLYAMTPLLMVPIYWQRVLMPTDLEVPEGAHAFDPSNLIAHTADFLRAMFRFDFYLPYASVVNLAGLVFLGVLGVRIWTRAANATAAERSWWGISAALVGTYWVVVNAHYSPFALIYDGVRLLVPAVLVLSVSCALGLGGLAWFRARPFYFVSLAAAVFCTYHPMSLENRGWNAVLLTREYRNVTSFLERQGHRNFLVIAYRPGIYTARDWGAVSFLYANANREALMQEFRQHLYRDLFVVQEIDLATGQPSSQTALDPAFALEPLIEFQKQIPALTKTRISRVRH